jgi:hypothetical protein
VRRRAEADRGEEKARRESPEGEQRQRKLGRAAAAGECGEEEREGQ